MLTIKSSTQTFTRRTLGEALDVVKDQRIKEALISDGYKFNIRAVSLSRSNVQILPCVQ